MSDADRHLAYFTKPPDLSASTIAGYVPVSAGAMRDSIDLGEVLRSARARDARRARWEALREKHRRNRL